LIERADDRVRYEHDFRHQVVGLAAAVARPATTEQVSKVLALCNESRVGVVPHGGNTSYCAGATPDPTGTQIVLSLERMNRIRSVDRLDYSLTAEAGCVLAAVQQAAEAVDRLFPLSLGSEGSCQIGGNLSTNAGGTAVLRYGMTRDLVLGLEVVLADGRVLNSLRRLRKDNRGYDLKQLFIGAEGSLGIITAAALRLFALPSIRATAIAAVPDIEAAVQLLSVVRDAAADTVTTFELMPRIAVALTARHVPGVRDPFSSPHPWYVLVELAGSATEGNLEVLLQDTLGDASEKGLVLDAVIATSQSQRESMWKLRESIPEAQRHAGPSLKHDVSVPITSLARFAAQASAWLEANVPDGDIISYGHLGDGSLHFNVQLRAGADPRTFEARAPQVRRAIHDFVAALDGSFSAEHGIGRTKVEELERYKSAVELQVMRSLKQVLDPNGILNPGSVLR